MRRDLIPLAMALVLVPATVAAVLTLMTPAPTVLAFPKPTHRVAVAVDEAMRSELATVDREDGEFSKAQGLGKPDHQAPEMGEVQIPEDHPAFWLLPLTISDHIPSVAEDTAEIIDRLINGYVYGFRARSTQKLTSPILVTLNEIEFDGQTRDGRDVKVTVRIDTIGEGTIVDCHDDAELAQKLSTRITDRLAHPRYKHESPEDREALMAFFGATAPKNDPPSPLTNVQK